MPSEDPPPFSLTVYLHHGREDEQGGMGRGASQPGLLRGPSSAVETLPCQAQSHCCSMTLSLTPTYTLPLSRGPRNPSLPSPPVAAHFPTWHKEGNQE